MAARLILAVACLLLTHEFSATGLTFPKCSQLMESAEADTFCALCYTSRVQAECKAECESKNCQAGGAGKPKPTVVDRPEETEAPEPKKGRATKAPKKKSKKTDDCDGIEPCVELDRANSKFKDCCVEKNLASTCISKCRYEIKRNELQSAVLGGQCPIDGMRKYLNCAAGGKDNNRCCKAQGVLDKNRAVCRSLCHPDGDDWPENREEAKKLLPCLSQFDAIMRCHWASVRDD